MSSDEIVVRETDSSVVVQTATPEQSILVTEGEGATVVANIEEAVVVRDDPVVVDVQASSLETVSASLDVRTLELRGPRSEGPSVVVSGDEARAVTVQGPSATASPWASTAGKYSVPLVGAKDGANRVYSTPETFILSTLRVIVNGVRQQASAGDFEVISASGVRLAWPLREGDVIFADYFPEA
jgi:hypothetical protein